MTVALWTASDVTAALVAAAALMTAILTGFANLIAVWRAEVKIDHNTALTDAIKTDVAVVSGHVNSAATASTTKIEALEREVALLRDMLNDQKSTAAMLAQSHATQPPVIVVSAPPTPKEG